MITRDYSAPAVSDYGAEAVLAEYLKMAPDSNVLWGHWQHAWIGPYRNVHPELVIGGNGKARLKKRRSRFFVARQDQVEFLKNCGFKNVYSIGAPVVYLRDLKIRRVPNSLLVVPMHSLPDTKEDWSREGKFYAEFIRIHLNRFEKVTICIHPSCLKKGFWTDEFRDIGVDFVEGADPSDRNSLLRMQSLFSQYEFVTTNGHGSQVAYASYFGAKVSVCGPKPAWDSSKRTDVFFQNAPETLADFEKWRTTSFLDDLYSQFNVLPHMAVENRDWAAWELGLCSKLSPPKLRALVSKNLNNRIKFFLNRCNFIFN